MFNFLFVIVHFPKPIFYIHCAQETPQEEKYIVANNNRMELVVSIIRYLVTIKHHRST